jgi:hypothetical protein
LPRQVYADKLLLFIVVVLVLITNGTWLQHDNNVATKAALLLVLILFFFYKGIKKQLSFPNVLVVFFILFPIISTYFVNLSPDANVVNIINTSIQLLLFSFLPLSVLNKLFELYSRMIYFLVCVAVPLGILFLAAPQLLEKTPVVNSPFFDVAGGHWYNLIVYTERSINDFRVQSVFWEPGAWAYNQMVAFYYLIFIKQEYKKVPVFLLSILLTLSTSGLLACFICLIPLLGKFKKSALLIGGAIFTVLVGIVGYAIASNEILSEIFYQNTLGKFSSDHISFEERTTTAANAFKIANDHWLFGIGRMDSESFMYVTSSISEIAYQLGYLYLIVYLLVFLQVFKEMGWLLAIPFCFIILNSEAYSFFSLNIFLIVLGSKLLLLKSKNAQHKTASVQMAPAG